MLLRVNISHVLRWRLWDDGEWRARTNDCVFGSELDEIRHTDAVLLELLPVHVAQDAHNVLQSPVVGARDFLFCEDDAPVCAAVLKALLPRPCVVEAESDGGARISVAAARLPSEEVGELH